MISPIVPVLDLMIGQVVLASGGNRAEYRPVHSKLTHSSWPIDVAKAMFLQTGCDCLYLADIDSFAGAEPNWNAFNQLLTSGFGLWVDANWIAKDYLNQIPRKLNSTERLQIILSSETMGSLKDFDNLEQIIESGHKPIFSLDKKGDAIITQPGEIAQASPLELVKQAYDKGVRDFIVLDLDAVGTMQKAQSTEPSMEPSAAPESSSLIPLLQEIASELPDARLTSGGGIRSSDDAQNLLSAGCQHVLVASAIHECCFTPDDVAKLTPFRAQTSKVK